ncbi:MAG: cytochrome-c oxidase, cbb3-type subunit III [Nitrospinota bacterium]
MAMDKRPESSGDLGHEWDGIRELDNDPPRWWMIAGYITIIFLVVYFVLYPAVPYAPFAHGNSKGVLGYTQIDEYRKGLEAIKSARAPWENKIASLSTDEVLHDSDLLNYISESSRVTFGEYCAPCHDKGGQGFSEFPNLTDDDWLYGGTVDEIIDSIRDGREGVMNAYKTILSQQEIDDLVKYVTLLPDGEIYEEGRKVFLGQTEGEADCASCHGEDGKGIKAFGATNLTDSIWRFSGSPDEVKRTIEYGINAGIDETRRPLMPPFTGKISEDRIKTLAIYVWALGGGQTRAEPEGTPVD